MINQTYSQKVKEAMMLTKVEQLFYEDARNEGLKEGWKEGWKIGWKEGWKIGIEEGKKDAEYMFSNLMLSLLSDQRYSDIETASKDPEYREELYQKYGIHPLE